jgi:hypothetical protein
MDRKSAWETSRRRLLIVEQSPAGASITEQSEKPWPVSVSGAGSRYNVTPSQPGATVGDRTMTL